MGLVYKCDRCGEIIPDSESVARKFSHRNVVRGNIIFDMFYNRETIDQFIREITLCKECDDSFIHWFLSGKEEWYFMNKQYFQVNVTMATPACRESCPNLQIDIEDLKYTADNVDDLYRLRQIRCVNDSYCQNLYRAFEERREADVKPELLNKTFHFRDYEGTSQ